MEAIFLDSMFKVTRIVDAFSSFIWNDRYVGYGDFELRFPMVDGALGGIEIGNYLTNNLSDRYMIVEGIEMRTSIEDGNTVTITGRSLESILDRRIVIDRHTFMCGIDTAILVLVSANILNPIDDKRRISKFYFKDLYPFDQNPFKDILVNTTVEKGKNLYNAIYDICYEKNVGFRCVPNDSDGTIGIELYLGEDRSYKQSKNPWIVFSPKFENIQETDMNINTENLRNVIYAESEYSDRIEDEEGNYQDVDKTIFVEIDDNNLSGMERRELYASSGETPERIDKSDFGEPEDRVNFYDYFRYEIVEFHESEYVSDWDTYWRWHDTVGPVNGNMWDPRNTYLPPNIENYYEREWVCIDEVGYQRALDQAAAQIQAEYEAAIANAEITAEELIREAAAEELANWMKVSEFDGEVSQQVQYIFGRDYNLGDILQIVNEYGFQARTRVVGMLYSEEAGTGFMMRPQFESDDKAVFDI